MYRSDVLLDDSGEVRCDPNLDLKCSQYLVSTEQPQSQDDSLGETGTTQDQNTDAGAGSRDKSQGPGPGTSIGQGSEYNATMILKKLNDLAGVAENTDFRNSVTGFKTVPGTTITNNFSQAAEPFNNFRSTKVMARKPRIHMGCK